VPVGEDQTQHLELTRTLARRFNDQFGGTFKVPEAYIPKVGARIMGLDDPAAKMSKSSAAPYHALKLLDDAKTVETKIKKAVTDSGSDIRHGEDKPAVTNLLTIFSLVSGQSIAALEKQYNGKGYADFKRDLAAAVNAFLAPIQKMYKDISDEEVLSVLHDGAEKANLAAEKTMKTVRERIGFVQ
jgi:tryptophanyl-tRNA synthetase